MEAEALKIIIEEIPSLTETEIYIHCPSVNEEVEAVIAQLRLYNQTISGKADGKSYVIPFRDVYYFDTADRRTFIYTASDVYECTLRLYQIEDRLDGTPFVRVNKSTILNLKKVNFVEGSLSGRLTASLLNGERVEISRMYVPDVKAKLEIK